MTLESSVAPSHTHPGAIQLEVANALRGGYPDGLVVSQDGLNVNRPALSTRIAGAPIAERLGLR